MSTLKSKFDNRSTSSSQYFQKRSSALSQLQNFCKEVRTGQQINNKNQNDLKYSKTAQFYSPHYKNTLDYVTEKTISSSKSIQKKFRDFSRQSINSIESQKSFAIRKFDKNSDLNQVYKVLNNEKNIVNQYCQWIDKQKQKIKYQFQLMYSQIQNLLKKKQSQIGQLLNKSFKDLTSDIKKLKKQLNQFYDDKIQTQKNIQAQNRYNRKLVNLKQSKKMYYPIFQNERNACIIQEEYFKNTKNNKQLINDLQLQDQRIDEAGRAYKFYNNNSQKFKKIVLETGQIKKYMRKQKISEQQISKRLNQTRRKIQFIIQQWNFLQ